MRTHPHDLQDNEWKRENITVSRYHAKSSVLCYCNYGKFRTRIRFIKVLEQQLLIYDSIEIKLDHEYAIPPNLQYQTSADSPPSFVF